jgi:hypothetical protein
MAKSKIKEINWIPEEEEHDYPAAESYLRILYSEDRVADMIARFREVLLSCSSKLRTSSGLLNFHC